MYRQIKVAIESIV